MTFNTRIQNKKDTAQNWENENPILLDGEIVVVDTNKLKIGDGITHFSDLPFVNSDAVTIADGGKILLDSAMSLASGPFVIEFDESIGESGESNNQGGYAIQTTFAEDFEGATYTVQGGKNESYSGIVPESLQTETIVKTGNALYTIKATAENNEYSTTVQTSQYYGQYPAELSIFNAIINITTNAPGCIVKAQTGDTIYTGTADEDGNAVIYARQTGTYIITATKDDVFSNSSQVEINIEKAYNASINFIKATITTPEECQLVLTKGEDTITISSTLATNVCYLPSIGTWNAVLTKNDQTAAAQFDITEYKSYNLNIAFAKIYGVSWDGTSTTQWTRTDDAALFTDPVPYVLGATSYNSPFDNCYPWSGMQKVNRAAGVMVSIPKFWYQLTQNGAGLSIKIAEKEITGYSVSPAHMDRGDGKGERDVVYVGRYHCATRTYKSTTGVAPQASKTRAEFRSAIHAIDSNTWMMDYQTRFTLFLLYLVEFADWNSQATIGLGCSNSNTIMNVGYTDSMPYHTGTTKSARNEYSGTQYRYIEGLWDNVYDFIDGCYNNANGVMIINNPAQSSDSNGGVSIGIPSAGYPSAFTVNNNAGYPMFIPTASNGSGSTYSCDYWNFNSTNPCVCCGGYYGQGLSRGLFCFGYGGVSGTGTDIGSRPFELP